MDILYYLNDNLLEVTGLQNAADNSYINDASVTAILKKADETAITGSLAFSYVAASDGDYRVTLADTLTLPLNQTIKAEVTADAGAGLKGFWEFRLKVKSRLG